MIGDEIWQLMESATRVARTFKNGSVTAEHLLAATLIEDDVIDMFTFLKVDYVTIATAMGDYLENNRGEAANVNDIDDVVSNIISAVRHRFIEGGATVYDVIEEILSYPADAFPGRTMLSSVGITSRGLNDYLDMLAAEYERNAQMINVAPVQWFTNSTIGFGPSFAGVPRGNETTETKSDAANKDDEKAAKEIAAARKTLDGLATNLNEQAKKAAVDPLIGRTNEIEQMVRILRRRRKNNPLLIGEPGVGKTAIAEGLALKIVQGDVPAEFKDAEVYNVDIGQMVAGTKFRGEFEERVTNLINAVKLLPHVILFIDEIHLLVGGGQTSGSGMDAANLFKPALARGQIRCIGATTYDDYMTHFESDRALVRRFKKVRVEAPSIEEAKAIVMGLRAHYEKHHGVSYTAEAIEAAVELTERYVRNAALPDKAIDMIDEAGARAALAGRKKIDVVDIENEVATVTNIPLSTIREDEGTRIMQLEERLSLKVFGQDAALKAVSDAVKISRVGLRSPEKPEGSFIFSGPTGVGKTEVARALADELGVEFVRFDMSEYMEKHTVSRLIGSPPGYVGYGDAGAGSGLLVGAVERTPRCVLLLDEVEKAHPDVFNILLQIMDTGKLTSSTGKPVDFRNTIVIMTTNAGASDMNKMAIGFGGKRHADADQKALRKFFAPEFLGRLDAIVAFESLTLPIIKQVVGKFMSEVTDMLRVRDIELVIDDSALDYLARNGFDPIYGARPLGTAITERVKLPLANFILTQKLCAGDKVIIRAVNEVLEISPETAPLHAIAMA